MSEYHYEDLCSEKEQLEIDMANIRNQLEFANAHRRETGEYVDYNWYYNAKHALRMRGISHQKVIRAIASIRKEEKAIARKDTLERFVDIARVRLSTEMFKEIMAEAST